MSRIFPDTYKDVHVCVSPQGAIDLNTVAWSREESIQKLLNGSSLGWKAASTAGWTCHKINVTFTIERK